MSDTSIQWTDKTWNPIRGCSMAKGSETGGCLNCYAARMAARNLPELKSPTTGESFARILPSGPRWTGKVELIESQLTLPLKWRKPQRIFVNSMSDLFHEALSDEAIDRVFAVMALCPQHTFQILTKRPERMKAWCDGLQSAADKWAPKTKNGKFTPSDVLNLRHMHSTFGRGPAFPYRPWPLPNVWLGVSVENQATADARIPLLLQTPAAVRFVSYEPALEYVNFEYPVSLYPKGVPHCCNGRDCGCMGKPTEPPLIHGIDWIICGGESGPGARPFDLDWARDVIRIAKANRVAPFFKQAGANVYDSSLTASGRSEIVKLKDRKGGDMSEWSPDLRVREFPEVRP